MTRRKIEPGSIVEIRLDEQHHTYARILRGNFVAAYDCRTSESTPDMRRIVGAPVLFVVIVYAYVRKGTRWPVVGFVPLEQVDVSIPPQFRQDVVGPDLSVTIIEFEGGRRERPGTIEEAEGLESLSVWDDVHVEERLWDHYAGRPSMTLASLKVRRTV